MEATTKITLRMGLLASFATLCIAATACGTDAVATDPPAPHTQQTHVTTPYVEHPPGSFHADTYCRSHLGHGVIRCGSNGPQRKVGRAYF